RHAAARPPDASLASAEVRRQELASERGRRSSCKARSERVNTHRSAAVNWGNLTRPRMGEFRVAAGGYDGISECLTCATRAPSRRTRNGRLDSSRRLQRNVPDIEVVRHG